LKLLLWLHSELCGQSSNFEGRKINNQVWHFNKCQVPYYQKYLNMPTYYFQ